MSHTSRDAPAGGASAFENDEGDDDETFSAETSNGSSHHSCMRPSAATSRYDFVPIGEDEAERIVARIRGLAGSEE